MVSYAALTDVTAVLKAIDECDALGREAFREKYGFGASQKYELIYDGETYDSKAIFGVAWGYQFGTPLSSEESQGGLRGAAMRLIELGFEVPVLDEGKGAREYATVEEALVDYPIPPANMAMLREFLSGREFTRVYIPRTKPYVSTRQADGSKVFIHRGFIWYQDAGRSEGVKLPMPVNGGDRERSSRSRKVDEELQFCPEHFVALSVSGDCQFC